MSMCVPTEQFEKLANMHGAVKRHRCLGETENKSAVCRHKWHSVISRQKRARKCVTAR